MPKTKLSVTEFEEKNLKTEGISQRKETLEKKYQNSYYYS